MILIEILLKLLIIKTPDESLRITTKPNQIDDGRVKLIERKNNMTYKSKNFTVKYYYHDEEENVNIYKVIDNKTKKRIYTGWFNECVNFVKEKENTQLN